jgi:glycosyltransferase involved in cell wall biosynthesis
MTNSITIVVPCYNEEFSISHVIRDLIQIANAEICVVNDGSKDGTSASIPSGLGTEITLIEFAINLGISEAVRAGALHSRESGRDFLIQCDGDGQHDSEAIWHLIERANDLVSSGIHDFVIIGSRYTSGYSETTSTTDLRIFGSKVLRFILGVLYRLRVTDPTSGLRLYAGQSIPFLIANYPTIWPETIFLGRLHKSKFQLHEVSVNMRPRLGGESKIVGVKSLVFMIKVSLALVIDKIFWRGGRTE